MQAISVPLFDTRGLMPHIHCYLNRGELVWLHGLSDLLIGVAYVSISATLVFLVTRSRDIPFQWVFVAFGTFIITCGITHFMEVYTLWTPAYGVAGVLKAITAFASIMTAILLFPLIPRVLAVARTAQLAHERGQKLETAHRELEALYTRIKEVDELKTRFFANVSHELRTPLTLILTPTEQILARETVASDIRRELEVVRRNARLLLRNVNDLLDVARLEAGKMTLDYERTDLAALTRRLCALFELAAEERQLRLEVVAPDVLTVDVDARKLERVLLNLLSNAFDFTPSGGVVQCTLEASDEEVRLRVEDSGPGIPAEQRQRIFDRFQQLDGSATRRHGGTGLGLAIVREFVELHRGRVEVLEASIGGACIELALPRHAPVGTTVLPGSEALEPANLDGYLAPATNTASPVAADADGRALVLIVEDNPEMNRFVSESLSRRFRVISRFDGRSGLEAANTELPDIIISDLMMPGLSGEQLVAGVRANPALEAVPILLLSARADDDLRVKLLQEGAQDYVMKPFSAPELIARIHNLVSVKRSLDSLREALASRSTDLESLVREVTSRQRELDAALGTTQLALEHAERSSRVKNTFLSLVSHELRTPLTIISTYLQVLARDPQGTLTPKQRDNVYKMLKASIRLRDLIDSLLEYARIKDGRLTINPEEIELRAVTEASLEDMRYQAEQKGLELRFHPPQETIPPLSADPRILRLIVGNLVGNAIKYTEKGGIDVYVAYVEGEHRLSVRDSGPGIPKDKHAQIFEPFEQLEPVAQKHTPGVGIGLALVREMTLAMRGRLELESEPGSGSTFTVVLKDLADPVAAGGVRA